MKHVEGCRYYGSAQPCGRPDCKNDIQVAEAEIVEKANELAIIWDECEFQECQHEPKCKQPAKDLYDAVVRWRELTGVGLRKQ